MLIYDSGVILLREGFDYGFGSLQIIDSDSNSALLYYFTMILIFDSVMKYKRSGIRFMIRAKSKNDISDSES